MSCIEPSLNGEFITEARNRMHNAGLVGDDMHRHQNCHAKPLNSGELGRLPAMIAFLYNHLDFTVQRREGFQQDVRAYNAEHAGRPLHLPRGGATRAATERANAQGWHSTGRGAGSPR